MEETVNMFNEWVVSDGDDFLDGCSLEELDMMSDRLETMMSHLEGKYHVLMFALGQLASRRMREVAQETEREDHGG